MTDRPLPDDELQAMREGKGIHVKYIPGTFVPLANPGNDWLIDRMAQKQKKSFSGVEGFSVQDASLQESMGPIQDYAREHLVSTDRPIVMARRMLARTARALESGVEPPALDADAQSVRAASVLLQRQVKAEEWAKEALATLQKPVYSV
jgi:phthalate 4,5-dioxygenase oxygenase subunit